VEIVRRVHTMKEARRDVRAIRKRIGFVPTMGALHAGHLSLVRRVRELCDVVVVSIFVNPTQFGPAEDFERYPRDLARDVDLCAAERVDYVFAPEPEEIYPAGATTIVEVVGLSSRLEGASRPGHFRGVTTVVLKLLEVVRPDVAVFGQKDAQQALVLRRMARDLLLDAEILVAPTVRDPDGVALSSRNVFLSQPERVAAQAIPRALKAAEEAALQPSADPASVIDAARAVLAAEPLLRVEYLELVETAELRPATALEGELLLAVAVNVGTTRLIDNTLLGPDRRGNGGGPGRVGSTGAG
jgi:pantoate--beta-alanine ligase